MGGWMQVMDGWMDAWVGGWMGLGWMDVGSGDVGSGDDPACWPGRIRRASASMKSRSSPGGDA